MLSQHKMLTRSPRSLRLPLQKPPSPSTTRRRRRQRTTIALDLLLDPHRRTPPRKPSSPRRRTRRRRRRRKRRRHHHRMLSQHKMLTRPPKSLRLPLLLLWLFSTKPDHWRLRRPEAIRRSERTLLNMRVGDVQRKHMLNSRRTRRKGQHCQATPRNQKPRSPTSWMLWRTSWRPEVRTWGWFPSRVPTKGHMKSGLLQTIL